MGVEDILKSPGLFRIPSSKLGSQATQQFSMSNVGIVPHLLIIRSNPDCLGLDFRVVYTKMHCLPVTLLPASTSEVHMSSPNTLHQDSDL